MAATAVFSMHPTENAFLCYKVLILHVSIVVSSDLCDVFIMIIILNRKEFKAIFIEIGLMHTLTNGPEEATKDKSST